MATITLDLPEPAMARLLSMPEPERNRFVADLILDEDEDEEITFVADPIDFTPVNLDELPPEDRAAVLRGIASAEAGRVSPMHEAMARIEAEFLAGRPAREAARTARTLPPDGVKQA